MEARGANVKSSAGVKVVLVYAHAIVVPTASAAGKGFSLPDLYL